MKSETQSVEVWASGRVLSPAPGEPRRMGTLTSTRARGKEVFAFEYDREWLDDAPSTVLDPTLRLHRGPQYLADGRNNFGVFLDSSPDRWGRVLMRRREALRAREEHRKERHLFELDHLLGVHDGHRLGGLRFRVAGGPFLDDDDRLAAPPWTSLRELEHASLRLERDDAEKDPSYAKWLRMLVAPGRSLGGARPKASVVDERGLLWIAKFPSADDSDDVGAWETVVQELAARAGIRVPEARSVRLGRAGHHTFLSRRFDREAGDRIHFVSAMTLLERSDGEAGASYLELAEVLIRHGARPTEDLHQLWRRIVFFVCVSNVDDHLRNHGFLLEPRGWALAPAYDMNPVAHGDGLTLNVSMTDNTQDLGLAREVAKHFRLSVARADEIIAEVIRAVGAWRETAKRVGLSRAAQDRMADAFRVADAALPR